MQRFRIFLALLCALCLSGCTFFPLPTDQSPTQTDIPASTPTIAEATAAPTDAPAQPTTAPTEPADYVTRLLSSMTLRQKVGQLFLIRPDSLDFSQTQEQINDANATGVTALSTDMIAALEDYPAGGIVQFGKNITSPAQLTQFNADLQKASRIALFIAVDEEGGLVSRLANHKAFDLPTYKNAASIQTVQAAQEMGQTIGTYLAKYGFNLDFAPVADVNTNPDNPIIGTRAFSSDPDRAAALASAMADGLNAQGILATFKHFPGHGDTAEDSHLGLATSHKTYEEMQSCEWIPFRMAGANDLIMVGHIATPEITGDSTPASLSYKMVTEILKNQLGFEGLVITDSLAMEAITDAYGPGEAALAALNAGCDLLLMPNGYTQAFDAVVQAVEHGTYAEETLNATVERILRFKLSSGLLLANSVG